MGDGDRANTFWRRTTTRRTAGIVGGAALLLGFALGSGAGRTDPTQSQAYLSLQGDFEAASDDRTELEREAEALAEDNAELADANRELEGAQGELESAQNTLEQGQAELDGDRAALEESKDKLAASLARFKSRLADLQAREDAVAAAEADAYVAPPAAEAPASAYYDNCTAARNAGAAPVRVGDPGYGRHLDRDGDGVGCEW